MGEGPVGLELAELGRGEAAFGVLEGAGLAGLRQGEKGVVSAQSHKETSKRKGCTAPSSRVCCVHRHASVEQAWRKQRDKSVVIPLYPLRCRAALTVTSLVTGVQAVAQYPLKSPNQVWNAVYPSVEVVPVPAPTAAEDDATAEDEATVEDNREVVREAEEGRACGDRLLCQIRGRGVEKMARVQRRTEETDEAVAGRVRAGMTVIRPSSKQAWA